MGDLSPRDNVLNELEFEPSINAAHIGVVVDNGVVTLSGHAGSYAEKVFHRVKGGRAIAEEIEVRWPSDQKANDYEIAQRALRIIRPSPTARSNSRFRRAGSPWPVRSRGTSEQGR